MEALVIARLTYHPGALAAAVTRLPYGQRKLLNALRAKQQDKVTLVREASAGKLAMTWHALRLGTQNIPHIAELLLKEDKSKGWKCLHDLLARVYIPVAHDSSREKHLTEISVLLIVLLQPAQQQICFGDISRHTHTTFAARHSTWTHPAPATVGPGTYSALE